MTVKKRRYIPVGMRLENRTLMAVVLNTHDSGPGSLREAILDGGYISFDIDVERYGNVIELETPLPDLSDDVTVDGRTQPKYAGTPIIQIDGASLPSGNHSDGFYISGSDCVIAGLSITNFSGAGIEIGGFNASALTTDANWIFGNFIGVDPSGRSVGPNGVGVSMRGAVGTVIGTNGDGVDDAKERNVISGNTFAGVEVVGSTEQPSHGNVVARNFIGTDPTGTIAIGNGYGIYILDAWGNRVGSFDDASNTPPGHNVISGNIKSGIAIFGELSNDNIVTGNFIGVDVSGAVGLPNLAEGIDISFAHDNRIGTNADGIHDDWERNIISGNKDNGIYMCTEGTTGNVIAGNYIGTDVTGLHAVGNGASGIVLTLEASDNTVGGTAAAAANVISGNGTAAGADGSGVDIFETGTTANVVLGNLIGTGAKGDAAIGNGGAGVTIFAASDNTIGGTSTGARNIISGNGARVGATGYAGVEIAGAGAEANLVAGNLIGTDVMGTKSLGNSDGGVLLLGGASNNTIGGTTRSARNIISGNNAMPDEAFPGVLIGNSSATDNIVEGNFIGTNITGTKPLANKGGGLTLINDTSGNSIGGSTDGAGNLISGNTGYGVDIEGTATSTNVVQGNFIGSDITAKSPLPNSLDGVIAFEGASNNTIGGTGHGAGNVIAFNGRNGVAVGKQFEAGPLGDAIEGNSIFGNAALGIDLGSDGRTFNDSWDHTAGPNHWQNFPTLLPPDASGTIVADLKSAPGTYRIEFFANDASSTPGTAQAQTYLGAVNLFVDVNGEGSVTFTRPASVSSKAIITATATSAAGDTSEIEVSEPLDWVTFGGAGFFPITSDVDDFHTYSSRQWLGGNNPHNWPVLYGAGSVLTVSAEWAAIASIPAWGSILAKATTSNGLMIMPTVVNEQGDGKLVLPPVALNGNPNPTAARATTPFGNKANFYQDFVVSWQLSFDGGRTWIDAGKSRNPLYVSASEKPLADPDSNEFFLTVVDSEINATAGLSTSTNRPAIIAKTWDLFRFRAVRQVSPTEPFSLDRQSPLGTEHGTKLTYYGNGSDDDNSIVNTIHQFTGTGFTNVVTVKNLLATGDGQSSTLAGLFLDMLLASGIQSPNDFIEVKAAHSDGFLVKNWAFSEVGSSGDRNYPYFDLATLYATDTLGNRYILDPNEEVVRVQGVPGQNSANPAAAFHHHYLAFLNGIYYDPSDGNTYKSLDDMASQDIAGYFKQVYTAASSVLGIGDLNVPQRLFVSARLIQKREASNDFLIASHAGTWSRNGLGSAAPTSELPLAPTSRVDSLASTTTARTFTVRITGADDYGGADGASFALFVSVDGGPFRLAQAGIPAEPSGNPYFSGSTTFTGVPGHVYGFYSVATNNFGSEDALAKAQATVTILAQPLIKAVAGSGTAGGTATLTATLTANGLPLAGKPVRFTLTKGSTIIAVGSATTNSRGVATLRDVSLTGFAARTYAHVVGAIFKPDATDLGARAFGDLKVKVATGRVRPPVLTSIPAQRMVRFKTRV
jgi:hypothetical protein